MSKYGVFPGPYFPAFGLNTQRYGVSVRIQSECGKIRTRKNSVFRHFSRSVCLVISRDHVLKEPCDVIGAFKEPRKASHQPAKFDSHKHCGDGDISVLFSQVISKDHMIKGSCNLRAPQGKLPSWKICWL